MDESQVITRALGGDAESVGELYDRHHKHIFRFIWSRVGDQQLAEDLTGEVFVRMLSALPRYRAEGLPFRAWLYRMARNLLVDHFRKEGKYTLTSIDNPPGGHNAHFAHSSSLEDRLTLVSLQQALASLEDSQHEIIILRFINGLSLREVAGIVSRSEAGVKALQHRGLRALRLALAQEDV